MLVWGSLLALSIAAILFIFKEPKKQEMKGRDFRDRYKAKDGASVERRSRDAGAPEGVERRGQGFGRR